MLLFQLDWHHVAGFVLFSGASLLQHQSMVLLAGLRTGKSGKLMQLSLFKTNALCGTFTANYIHHFLQ